MRNEQPVIRLNGGELDAGTVVCGISLRTKALPCNALHLGQDQI